MTEQPPLPSSRMRTDTSWDRWPVTDPATVPHRGRSRAEHAVESPGRGDASGANAKEAQVLGRAPLPTKQAMSGIDDVVEPQRATERRAGRPLVRAAHVRRASTRTRWWWKSWW